KVAELDAAVRQMADDDLLESIAPMVASDGYHGRVPPEVKNNVSKAGLTGPSGQMFISRICLSFARQTPSRRRRGAKFGIEWPPRGHSSQPLKFRLVVAVARHVAEAVGEQELAALLHAGAGGPGAVGV